MGGDTFAAAGFPDQAQCFTGLNGQADVVNSFGHEPANIKIGSQIFYFQQVVVLHKV
jgi:hypothetical protein